MRSFITPDLVWRQPINALTIDQLKSYGLRALILDVDNTLVTQGEDIENPENEVVKTIKTLTTKMKDFLTDLFSFDRFNLAS